MSKLLTDDELGFLQEDAIQRYRRAVELAAAVREEWERQGCVLTVQWPNGSESEAPLLRLLREVERDASRLGKLVPLSPKRPGRPPVAMIKPPILRPD